MMHSANAKSQGRNSSSPAFFMRWTKVSHGSQDGTSPNHLRQTHSCFAGMDVRLFASRPMTGRRLFCLNTRFPDHAAARSNSRLAPVHFPFRQVQLMCEASEQFRLALGSGSARTRGCMKPCLARHKITNSPVLRNTHITDVINAKILSKIK